jgi:hypothetical protein
MRAGIAGVVLGLAALLGGCGDAPSECSRLKDELVAQIRAQNPTLAEPVEIYKQEYRELVAQIGGRGCTPADLGAAPLLCYLGNLAEACPPGYDCRPEAQEICRRR